MPDQAPEETIIVAPFWPGEGYGGGAKVTSMEEALAEAKQLAKQGYGKGKSIIHIVRTTRTVIEWNSDHSDLAVLPRPEADEGAVEAYDIPDQLERLADYLAPLHGAWVARTAARELRDGRSRYRAVASALCRERGLVPDELISDAGHEVWELVGHEAVQKESAALAAAQEGSK